MRRFNIIYNDFFCINCGNKITLPRKKGHQYKGGHLKKCYCYQCKHTVNFFEAKNRDDVQYFQEAFKANEFVKLAKESIEGNYLPTGLLE